MDYVLNSAQMQQCDKNTMEHFKMPSAVLMERAALAVSLALTKRFPDKKSRFLVACGVGNNGGDGLAIARLLFLKGYPVTVLFPGKEEKCSVEGARQLSILRQYGIPLVSDMPKEEYRVIVDALFGIGLTRDVGGVYKEIILALNEKDAYKVAVDIPSGIDADTGAVRGVAFLADLTVTFGFAKIGQLLYPGASYAGVLEVADIGIDERGMLDFVPPIRVLTKADMALLPCRKADSNKGSYGRLLIFAGSFGMAGAAAFSAKAAYRMGCGLVKIVTHKANREILQTLVPEAVLSLYDEETCFSELAAQQLPWADAVILGPGLGLSAMASQLLIGVVLRVQVPCLIDADGLNILAKSQELLSSLNENFVLTPHLKEMERLSGIPVGEIKADLMKTALDFSMQHGAVTVLKDARTVTAAPDGTVFINTAGNDGMATAGSGDVLTGIIGALLAQKEKSSIAAALGVYLHALAGDMAAKGVGKRALVASDIIDGIKDMGL